MYHSESHGRNNYSEVAKTVVKVTSVADTTVF